MKSGTAILGVLACATALGPFFAADPSAIVDPPAASVLPPLSTRIVIERLDGSSVAAIAAKRQGSDWSVLRRGTVETVPAAEVATVTHRRFWLGTDTLGRDVLARVLAGGRVSLAVGALALLVALVLGVGVGLVAGWRGGLLDAALMRVVDALLAVPMMFLLILLAAVFRPSLLALVLVLGFSSWMGVARLVRGQVLSLRNREFVLSARAIGASSTRIALHHLLPNLLTPLTQDAALRLGDLILVEASLSYLGLGVQPPLASWGGMVAEGQDLLGSAWWLTFIPGVCVTLTVIGAALFADGLSELSRGGSPVAGASA